MSFQAHERVAPHMMPAPMLTAAEGPSRPGTAESQRSMRNRRSEGDITMARPQSSERRGPRRGSTIGLGMLSRPGTADKDERRSSRATETPPELRRSRKSVSMGGVVEVGRVLSRYRKKSKDQFFRQSTSSGPELEDGRKGVPAKLAHDLGDSVTSPHLRPAPVGARCPLSRPPVHR